MTDRRMVRPVLIVAVAALLALAGCGSSSSSSTKSSDGACVAVKDGKVTIEATTVAFETTCLTMAPGDLEVTFKNKDKGVSHNFHLEGVTPKVAGKDRTMLKTGPDTQTVAYVDIKPGTYKYVCDIHPLMKGELRVVAAGTGTSDAGATS